MLVTGTTRQQRNRSLLNSASARCMMERLPQEKVEIVKRFQAEGRIVAFVGDG